MKDNPLPNPLVPADVDLRGYEFMPLFGDRLFGSETWISACAEARNAMLKLWWRSYAHELPAASLPNNDQLLSDYAGYGIALKAWKKIKSDAMRGFVLCGDGRLYHPFVAELAKEAWQMRVAHSQRTLKGRIASLEKRLTHATTAEERQRVTDMINGLKHTLSQTTSQSVTDPATRSYRTGQDRTETGQLSTTGNQPPAAPDADPVFGPYLALLTGKGIHADHARAFMALMRRGYGDELVLTVLQEAQRLDVTAPLPWIKKALEHRTRNGNKSNKQEALEERNRRATQDWQPPEIRNAAQ